VVRKLIRSIRNCAGHGGDVWPVALLLAAVLVPAMCLLWFMAAAMRNERLAARQKLTDAYRGQLGFARERLAAYWGNFGAGLERIAREAPSASAAFAKCVESGVVESVVILDGQERVLYPNQPIPVPEHDQPDPRWIEAGRIENRSKDFASASLQYAALAEATTNLNLAARALQGEARCLVRSGRNEAAVRIAIDQLGSARFRQAVDPQGRLIVANAELMVLELVLDRATQAFQSTARRLRDRLLDYDNPSLAASQRRFLMRELSRLCPELDLPLLHAEDLAAPFVERGQWRIGEPGLRRAPVPGAWQFMTPDRRVLALFRSDTLPAVLREVVAGTGRMAADPKVELIPPDQPGGPALLTVAAGESLPGWQLALVLDDSTLFQSSTEHQAAIYLWTGVLVVTVMIALTWLAVRILRRQAALTRLKHDLAATVSHELKTPLASMRVLVDTLLASEDLNAEVAREYLQLIARENDRLSRLIQNFLAYSRIERRNQAFQFGRVPVQQVIDEAVDAVRERCAAAGCEIEIQAEADLPDLMGDSDAMVTALVNLLDNACKYSEDIRGIVLQAALEGGQIVISVRDRGIGIALEDRKRIFQPFVQVDEHLSRKAGGCGLGLSIVQYIMKAHGGRVKLLSRPGDGTTVMLSFPVARAGRRVREESIV
jgi:signal transduction histidine kinase